MRKLVLRSAPEQVADHLREEILRGKFRLGMPGYRALSGELGVNHKTVRAALELLERQGLLVPQGAGKRCQVMVPENPESTGLHVRILLFHIGDRKIRDMLELFDHLHSSRHIPDFANRSQMCLKSDVDRISRFVARNPADAWVVFGGSREILEWFAKQEFPSLALLGRMRGLRMPGVKPDKVAAQRAAVRRLVDLGHRRIVKIVLEGRVKPHPGLLERSFLEELEAAGIPTGPYNLCTWNGNPKELYIRLEALFRHTPPSAVFLDAVSVFYATQDYLARKGILAPDHVSLICDDPDPPFTWYEPSVAHIDWAFEPLARLVVRWLDNVAAGKDDYRQSFAKATFIDGGTIGPVPE